MKAWLMLMMLTAGMNLQWAADRLGHLTTDPACTQYRAPRQGSRLDRFSRGVPCGERMTRRAFGLDTLDLWGPDECQGHAACNARVHEHGCYADLGNCDDPDEHKS